MADIIAAGPRMTFGDVRRDRDRRSSQLAHEAVTFVLGELLRRTIGLFSQVHRLLPDSEVAVAPHGSSDGSGRGHEELPIEGWGNSSRRPSNASPIRCKMSHCVAEMGLGICTPRVPSPESLS